MATVYETTVPVSASCTSSAALARSNGNATVPPKAGCGYGARNAVVSGAGGGGRDFFANQLRAQQPVEVLHDRPVAGNAAAENDGGADGLAAHEEQRAERAHAARAHEDEVALPLQRDARDRHRRVGRHDLDLLERYADLRTGNYCLPGCNACQESCPAHVDIAEVLRNTPFFKEFELRHSVRYLPACDALLSAFQRIHREWGPGRPLVDDLDQLAGTGVGDQLSRTDPLDA